jgi:hypothetical protein
MLNLPDRITTELNAYLSQEKEVHEYDVENELKILVDEAIVDCSHDETVEAFVSCEEAWRNFAAIEPVDNVYRDLNPAQLMYLVTMGNTLLKAISAHMHESMRPLAEEKAAE